MLCCQDQISLNIDYFLLVLQAAALLDAAATCCQRKNGKCQAQKISHPTQRLTFAYYLLAFGRKEFDLKKLYDKIKAL
jgi:hypothetical protein